jgi:hypothetical protein
MNTSTLSTPNWSTASFGDDAVTSPMELAALGEHLSLCRRSSGHLFNLRCGADAVHGFITTRFMTTLAVAVALLAVLGLLAP